MSLRTVVLLIALVASGGWAQAQNDRPLREPVQTAHAPRWRMYAIPALEGATINFGLLAFSNLVTRMPFALVSQESLVRNVRLQSWTFDVDYYLTNQFGHPYQGAQHFNAARSSGLSFWWSTLYASLGSLTWELFFEAERPSVNDQITTTIGGALLGEVLHRAALEVRTIGGPTWLGVIGATLLDPLGSINGVLLDAPAQSARTLGPMWIRWQLGAIAGVVVDRVDRQARDLMLLQAVLAVDVVSGAPWAQGAVFDSPMSYFDLRADLSFPSKVVGNIFIRGLLAGQRLGHVRGPLKGVWGLFGAYDYAAPAIVRASAVGLGPGVALQRYLGSTLFLRTGGFLGLSPFAAAGQLLNVSPDAGRDYHVGPGLQSMGELRLIRPDWFELELTIRNWLVLGAYTQPNGFESITYVTVGGTVVLWRWLGIGGAATLSDRRARFAGDGNEHDTGLSLRLTLSVMSAPHFGISSIPSAPL